MIRDLDTLGGTTGFANWISDAGDVAGTASNQGDQALHAFLWKNGTMTDLEIVASGVLPNGDPRAVLLIPCDENHPNIDGCEYSLLDTSSQAITHSFAPTGFRIAPLALWRLKLGNRLRIFSATNK